VSYTPLLTVEELRARAILPVADLRRALGLQWRKVADDALAANATLETIFGQWNDAGDVLELVFVPSKGLVADISNNATINVYKRTAGGDPELVGSTSTDSLGWTASAPVPLAISSSALAAGDVLSVEITKAGSGVIVPAGELFATLAPNFVTLTIDDWTSEIVARLAKRYTPPTDAKPWPAPVTNILKRWATKLVARDLYAKRGFSPSSEQDKAAIEDAAAEVEAKLKEAADGQNGLFELSLGDAGEDDVERGAPLSYAEQSPYTAMSNQRRAGRLEDEKT
jgi:hypothetical protein